MTLDLINSFCRESNMSLEKWYRRVFGLAGRSVMQAVACFSRAFEEFPFDLAFLYYGPQNVGCANLWTKNPTGLEATMVGFPFDDVTKWKGKYPTRVFLCQLEKLVAEWEQGMEILKTVECCGDENANLKELHRMAECVFLHFASTLDCAVYTLARDGKLIADRSSLIRAETQRVKRLCRLVSEDSRIGFEPSNHYYYHRNTLLEKMVSLKTLLLLAK